VAVVFGKPADVVTDAGLLGIGYQFYLARVTFGQSIDSGL